MEVIGQCLKLAYDPFSGPLFPDLNQMREDLDRDPADFPLADLWPVLIPSPILALPQWVGPRFHFAHLPVSLTWAYLRPEQSMQYLSTSTVAALELRGVPWRATAYRNLCEAFDGQPWTHEFKDEEGFVGAVAMLHNDGLGPSRLICHRKLLGRFPEGFVFFVPERSSAVVLSNKADQAVRQRVEQAVRGCIRSADVPMSDQPHTSQDLIAALSVVPECA
jgi:hypothetical protein